MDDRVYPSYGAQNNGYYNNYYKGFDYRYPLGQPPPPYSPPPQQRRANRGCICCCSILIGLILALSIAALLIYFLVHPKAPKYSIQDATISQFNLSAHHPYLLTSHLLFTINARNPNTKIGIYYDYVTVVASYEGAQIGQGSTPPFYQGHQTSTLLSFDVKGRDVALHEGVGSDLKQVLDHKESLVLMLKAASRVSIKIGSFKSWSKKIEVTCDVTLSAPGVGKTQILSKLCQLKKI